MGAILNVLTDSGDTKNLYPACIQTPVYPYSWTVDQRTEFYVDGRRVSFEWFRKRYAHVPLPSEEYGYCLIDDHSYGVLWEVHINIPPGMPFSTQGRRVTENAGKIMNIKPTYVPVDRSAPIRKDQGMITTQRNDARYESHWMVDQFTEFRVDGVPTTLKAIWERYEHTTQTQDEALMTTDPSRYGMVTECEIKTEKGLNDAKTARNENQSTSPQTIPSPKETP